MHFQVNCPYNVYIADGAQLCDLNCYDGSVGRKIINIYSFVLGLLTKNLCLNLSKSRLEFLNES